jgi:UDP-3-O-[3-hydroxymyristoyl] glucosamine N-acyltransferase
MERNIESILSELGFDYQFYGNIRKNKTFRNVATIQQGKEEDLCYCSFEGDEAISLISKSNAGIILCKRSLEAFIDQYYQRAGKNHLPHQKTKRTTTSTTYLCRQSKSSIYQNHKQNI